ncbi:hypothetical protein QOZ80_6AG0547990 [Eleusine coracana subsp. coracana]|nr:hypothetical protein QOZ80_6AG0547990 [Eleusine coracana subsp. coracana]
MAIPAATMNPHMPPALFEEAVVLPTRRRRRRRRRVVPVPPIRVQLQLKLIVRAAILLISYAASFVVYAAAKPPTIDDPVFYFVAFVLFLVGVWLALVALAADLFPRPAARVGESIARMLCPGQLIRQCAVEWGFIPRRSGA